MSKILYVETPAATATCLHCCDCDDEGEQCFHDGPAAIEKHNSEFPEHQRITWLRREAA